MLGGLKNVQIIVLGVCVAVATIFSTLILSKGVISIKRLTEEIIDVTGSAEMDIVSDYIVWTSGFKQRGPNLKKAYEKLRGDQEKVEQYLISKGIKKDEIVALPVTTTTLYKKTEEGHSTNDIEGYVVGQKVEVRSSDVEKVTEISRESTELLDQDIQFISSPPEYFYTKISELKIEMLARASANAKERADRMAQSTGNKIGVMRAAKMGTFQINPVNSYDVSWYGNHDTSSYEKKVISVVHVDFAIEK